MSKKQKKQKKQKKKQLFCVTTYSSFRHHYLVEADDAISAQHYLEGALVGVGAEPIEWQQKYLREVVSDTRVLTLVDAEQQHQERKSEGCPWVPLSSIIMRDGE
jgi:hypothetical protein